MITAKSTSLAQSPVITCMSSTVRISAGTFKHFSGNGQHRIQTYNTEIHTDTVHVDR